ncbi:hypothetical protein FQR65_LT03104 [Abscondita terminalis]|nr:hypothetical protein FQR65_LT03104 [Abscondita terminalis]
MIESCPRKRMLLGITFLGTLTICVLFVESHWTQQTNTRKRLFRVEQNSTCFEREKYEIVQECQPCTDFEIASKSIGVCIHTHYKEVLKCASGEMVTRSCDKVAYIEEHRFWKFEGFMFISASISTFSVICHTKSINLNIQHTEIQNEDVDALFKIDAKLIRFNACNDVPENANYCKWPVVVVGNVVTAGLSSVCRQIIKNCGNSDAISLLGFREACLIACNEVSIWTKFCEIDMIATVKDFITKSNNYFKSRTFYVPIGMSRFESHMHQPVKIHNVYKLAREKNKNKLLSSNVPVNQLNLEHKFSEGPYMTLSDILLYPCFKIFFNILGTENFKAHLPLTLKWFQNVSLDLKDTDLHFESSVNNFHKVTSVVHLPVTNQSLYTSDTKSYKSQNRIYTKQTDVEKALIASKNLSHKLISEKSFGHEISFSWNQVPLEASPESGALPESRQIRKCQQLENLAKATIKAARLQDENVIVDFCSGSGHLGILIAALLPKSHIILVENKERSLMRALDRINKMKLNNVSLVQSNLDYFQAKFNIGLALHACGVATDLVIQNCIKMKAHFICCPCCYGGIHDCHHLTYPRSGEFKNSALKYQDYLIIGHSADQTHEEENVKTAQGYLCMNIIDTDRLLYAKEHGYNVHLSKLSPPTCTPKNNLLVGFLL